MSTLRPSLFFTIRFITAVLLAEVSFGNALAANATEPAHLQAAFDLLKVIQPTDTEYQHKNGSVIWPGDPSGTRTECRTDCSGFVDALLKRSYGLNAAQFEAWFNTKRPVARDYHDAIAAGRGLQA